MSISLQPITVDTWIQVCRLEPSSDQKKFIAPNVYSIAQSKVQPECVPLAILAGEMPVGFAMYALDQDDGNYWIYRFMIDAEHQGKGYGRQALQALIQHMADLPGCDKILLGVVEGNERAEALYRGAGFAPTGEVIDEERVFCLSLADREGGAM